ncbi:MAG TPA: CGNR zinc finger domain-containing protein [Steroidobacteraceae bacterium]|jgi:predicted RNA-binding Zn ribbon-like protein|nr:CGNR zinc finger domain-containing protein [Steroidobacteraceae bacterium]
MGAHGPAIFIGDAPGLDFLNSVATPADATIDWIDDGEGLLSWIEQAQLVPMDVIRKIRNQALPGALDTIAAQARGLREWLRGFVLKHKGRPLALGDLAELQPLNRLLGRDEAYYRVVLEPSGRPAALELQAMRHWRSPEALLLPIGETVARFLCNEDFSNVRACEGPACTLLFVDRTRGHVRRWCSMAICGNRVKQTAHRRRVRASRLPRSRSDGEA